MSRKLIRVNPKKGRSIEIEGQALIDFSSNDYLGLRQHPTLQEAFIEGINLYGTGAGASQLIGGSTSIYDEVEALLAQSKLTESALLLNTGFQANATLISVLADRHSIILADRLCHRSLLCGAQLSGARLIRYKHNDDSHLAEKLVEIRKHSLDQSILIVTESLFGMDGDRANLDHLEILAEQYRAMLYVDEAHAMGVLGERGMGLAAGMPSKPLSMGTFGKGLGVFGAFVACSHEMRERIINSCSGFMFSTALPSALVHALKTALTLALSMDEERCWLQKTAEEFRKEVRGLGFNIGSSSAHIIPIIVGTEERARHLSQWLRSSGIYAYAVCPATVPKGASRIRISLSSAHSHGDIERVISALKNWSLRCK